MPTGKVKDPEGHQSVSYDFGYIQREDKSSPKWEDKKHYGQEKVIPFLNRGSDGKRIFNKRR